MVDQYLEKLRTNGFSIKSVADCYELTHQSGLKAIFNLRWKTKPVWGKIRRRFEFSIPKLQFDRYNKLDQSQSIRVYSIIIEKQSGEVLVAKIADLKTVAAVYDSDLLDKGGSVFVPKSAYRAVDCIHANTRPETIQ